MGKKSKSKTKAASRGSTVTDTGTKELSLRSTLKVERYSAGVRVRNITGSPLEALLYGGFLTDKVFGTIDDFLADMYRSGHLGLRCVDYNKVRVDGASQADEVPLLYTRVKERLSRINRLLGPSHVNVLYMLLNHDASITEAKSSKERVASILQDIAVVIDAA